MDKIRWRWVLIAVCLRVNKVERAIDSIVNNLHSTTTHEYIILIQNSRIDVFTMLIGWLDLIVKFFAYNIILRDGLPIAKIV